MGLSEVWHYSRIGLETFITSIKFFYKHLSLIMVSLLPSSIRAFQMLNPDAPFLLEGIVIIARCFLFLLIISVLTRTNINELKQKYFWDQLSQSCSIQIKKNWPYGFIAQIITFIVLLFGMGNLIINLTSGLFVSAIELTDIQISKPDALYNASVYFLKNMSVIPLTMVYMLIICGLRPSNN